MSSTADQPLFTREALEALEHELERNGDKITLPPTQDGRQEVIPNMYQRGFGQEPKQGEDVMVPVITLDGEIVYERITKEGRAKDYRFTKEGHEKDYRCADIRLGIRRKPPRTEEDLKNHSVNAVSTMLDAESDGMKELKATLLRHPEIMQRVKKIVCFDMVPLDPRSDEELAEEEEEMPEEEHRERSRTTEAMYRYAFVHEIACFISMNFDRTFQREHVYVQSPEYSSVDKKILKTVYRFEDIGGFGAKGFLMVDEDTMVVSHDDEEFTREAVLDMSRPACLWVSGSRETLAKRTKRILDNEYVEGYAKGGYDRGINPFSWNKMYFRKTGGAEDAVEETFRANEPKDDEFDEEFCD
ncbi:hypothetical protein G7054_g9464 [Neopestalotiopsis clavispora]|nr:hypothetical protein G7054_g9464 [Neopestalotiopsis clavispora]